MAMDEYEGSPELDVDLELLSLYEKRLERAIRVKDKVRRLARHHKVFLTDIGKLNENLERAKQEANQALEAKKRVLEAELERRFQEAKDAISDEVQARKMPLEQAIGDITRSNKVLESALEALEEKLKEPQHEFIQRFVPMIEEIESHVSHAAALRSDYDRLVDDNLTLASVDDFCRLTVRHRVKKCSEQQYPSSSAPAAGTYMTPTISSGQSKSPRPYKSGSPDRRPMGQFLSKSLGLDSETHAPSQGKYLSKRLGSLVADEGIAAVRDPSQMTRVAAQAQAEHLKGLVHDAYTELEDLYDWLRQTGVPKYSVAGPRGGVRSR